MAGQPKAAGSDQISQLAQYGCGPLSFTGTEEALYERHLLFDNVVDASQVNLRERFEAVARSVRDVLSQRWIRTEQTYERENPKRVYYLSIEFLLGRSLANNIENLLLDPTAKQLSRMRTLIGLACSSRNPTLVWAVGGWDVWRRASWIQWPRCNFRQWATDCVTNMGCLSSLLRMAGN
jgi:glycogen phosphorylase